MQRRAGVTVIALAVLGSAAVAALGATGRFSSKAEIQRAAWRDTPVSTSSTQWARIPGLAFRGTRDICAHGEVSAAVSLALTGGPVLVRVMLQNAAVALPMRPGRARFAPGPG